MTNTWTWDEEVKYGQWLHKTAAEDMLVGSGVLVDCADFAITLRWIYAHDHNLPAADQLAGSGELYGSWQSTRSWDRLPTNTDWKKDERFKAALRYLLLNSYTHSLQGDLYPVQINSEFVTFGTIYLTIFQQSGHTRTIFDIGPSKNSLGFLAFATRQFNARIFSRAI